MKHSGTQSIYIILIFCLGMLFTACSDSGSEDADGGAGDGGGTAGDGGAVEVNDYSIGSGETEHVTEDLKIVAKGKVDIAGDLVADDESGADITIEAEGEISVSGEIKAGTGASAENGGSITLISKNGSN